jgi:hypothetical protein
MANVHIFYSSDGNFDALLNNLIDFCDDNDYDIYDYDEHKDHVLKIVGERYVKFERDGYMFNVDDKPVINIIKDYSTEKFNSETVLRRIIIHQRRAHVYSIACCTDIDNFRMKEITAFQSITYSDPNDNKIYTYLYPHNPEVKEYVSLSQLIR